MKKNERLAALGILLKLVQQQKPLSQLLQSDLTLKPLTKEICFGVCRHYFRLETLADILVKKRPKSLDIWLILLIGLYQLYCLKKPDYAVVKETVSLLEQIKKPWAKGLVNAVLRTFCREEAKLIRKLQADTDFTYAHPPWFIKRIQTEWPEHWQMILAANEERPPMSLRVNQRQISREDYIAALQQKGIESFPLLHSSVGVQLQKACEVEDLPGFQVGEVSVQDESAQLAVSLLDLKPGLRVLDACSAPGGKTAHILEAEPHLSQCIALDVNAKRLTRVEDNLKRLKLYSKTKSIEVQVDLLEADATMPETWWDGQLFDRILLDAPCSATGIIRRQPDLKLLRTEKDIQNISPVQAALLHNLWPLLKPGGRMVYATCSVIQEENAHQIAQFMSKNTDCYLYPMNPRWGQNTGYGWQILPNIEGGDGFFYSVLMKTE